jgi:hypothetical protein
VPMLPGIVRSMHRSSDTPMRARPAHGLAARRIVLAAARHPEAKPLSKLSKFKKCRQIRPLSASRAGCPNLSKLS